MTQLSIIIPAYQEAENLDFILPLIKNEVDKMNITYEVLVIDTATPMDNTQDITIKNGFTYIQRQPHNFYGDAIRTGIQHAQGEYIIIMDGDGSHAPSFIQTLLAHKDKNRIVIASRYVQGGKTDNAFLLWMMSKMLNIIYALTLNIQCADMSNSFKLYNAEHLKKISIQCNNFDLVEEMIVKIKLQFPDVRIQEIPFYFENRKKGKTKRNLITFIFSFALTLYRLKKMQLQTKK